VWRADPDGLAAEGDIAGVRAPDAGDDLDECRLARAVVAGERYDLAGADVEVDAGEGVDRAEALLDPPQREQWGRMVGHAAQVMPAFAHAAA
jgi:hypothetical protein